VMVPQLLARLMELATLALVAGFGGAMAWYGALLAIGTWDARLPVLGVPGGVDYLPLVAGGALIAIFGVERFIMRLRGVALPAGDAVPAREVA
jgi:TRAP-type C4-dicarboxylate transport system permease small subunit